MKQILYSLLFLGSLATFTGCEEADYQELIPQEYNKILYLKNSGQNDLVLFKRWTTSKIFYYCSQIRKRSFRYGPSQTKHIISD